MILIWNLFLEVDLVVVLVICREISSESSHIKLKKVDSQAFVHVEAEISVLEEGLELDLLPHSI